MLHLVLDSKETQGKILGWAHDIMAANGEKFVLGLANWEYPV